MRRAWRALKRQVPRVIGHQRARTLTLSGLVGLGGVGGVALGGNGGKKGNKNVVGHTVEQVVSEKAAAEWDLPNLDHERVDYWVDRFTQDPDMRAKFEGFLQRSGRYGPMITEKLEERGMPRDLFYLAMIESGFEPAAYSHAHASGLWQFISETGQRYGLAIDRAVDERNDPVKATDAALDYLSDLHERFGSWYLAAASYNTGEGRVGRIMREETGSERAGSEEDYYRIWDRLPSETRDYVPLMIAAGRIAKEPAKYGFEHVELEAPYEYDEVLVPAATPLSVVAEAAGTDVGELQRLNPHLKIERTPNDREYGVRVPAGDGDRVAAHWADAVDRASMAEEQ